MHKYQAEFGLTEYDAAQLCLEKSIADYFEEVIKQTHSYKAVANWINGPVKSYLNGQKLSIDQLTLTPARLAEIVKLVEDGKVSFSVASTRLLPVLIEQDDKTALELANELNILQVSDSGELQSWVDEVINKMPDKVIEYKKGKKGLIGLFVGEVKKMSKGKADPKIVTSLLEEKLK